tara:strand:- start:717 stop:881 length:165 start_codon:yes stop_codon:yes gene_type:complete
MNNWRCAICLEYMDSHDDRHNATPFMEGYVCCTDCNFNIVVPYRIHLIKKGEEE